MDKGQGGNRYAGVDLPNGMTSDCAEEVVSLINAYVDELLTDDDGVPIEPFAVAVLMFRVVQKSLSRPQRNDKRPM